MHLCSKTKLQPDRFNDSCLDKKSYMTTLSNLPQKRQATMNSGIKMEWKVKIKLRLHPPPFHTQSLSLSKLSEPIVGLERCTANLHRDLLVCDSPRKLGVHRNAQIGTIYKNSATHVPCFYCCRCWVAWCDDYVGIWPFSLRWYAS